MSEYYYLISSLPELAAGEDFQQHPYPVFNEFAKEEMTARDHKSLRRCFLINDAVNLLGLLESRGGDDKTEWCTPSCFDMSAMEEGLQDTDSLPSFMADFIWDFRNDRRLHPQMSAVDELLSRMMDTLISNELMDMSDFTRDYLIFEMRLRNLTTALSHRAAGRTYADHIIEFDHFSKRVAAASAMDFGLGGELGVMSALPDAFDGEKNPVDAEKAVTAARWDWLDERVDYRMFSSEAVFAYAIKIADVERWMTLTLEAGRDRLDSLLERLHNDIRKTTQETAS